MKSTRRVLGHLLVHSLIRSLAHSPASKLMGKRFMSLRWMRRFHTVSTHSAAAVAAAVVRKRVWWFSMSKEAENWGITFFFKSERARLNLFDYFPSCWPRQISSRWTDRPPYRDASEHLKLRESRTKIIELSSVKNNQVLTLNIPKFYLSSRFYL